MNFLQLHDEDPVDYHAKLARLKVTSGFCERRAEGEKIDDRSQNDYSQKPLKTVDPKTA